MTTPVRQPVHPVAARGRRGRTRRSARAGSRRRRGRRGRAAGRASAARSPPATPGPGRSAKDTIAVWPETTQTTPGATRGAPPALAGKLVVVTDRSARCARSRSRRAIGPAPSPQRRGHLPALGRPPAVLGAGQVRFRATRAAPQSRPTSSSIDSPNRSANAQPWVWPWSERQTRWYSPRGELGRRGTAGRSAGRCCAARRGCRTARGRSGGRPRRSRGSRRRRPAGRPACPRAAPRRRRRGR